MLWLVVDLSESDEEDTFSSGPRSVIAQEPSRSEIQSGKSDSGNFIGN